MQIRYIGPAADGVEIADTGQWAKRLDWIEVELELGERLLEQSTWESKRSDAARKAAKARKADDDRPTVVPVQPESFSGDLQPEGSDVSEEKA